LVTVTDVSGDVADAAWLFWHLAVTVMETGPHELHECDESGEVDQGDVVPSPHSKLYSKAWPWLQVDGAAE